MSSTWPILSPAEFLPVRNTWQAERRQRLAASGGRRLAADCQRIRDLWFFVPLLHPRRHRLLRAQWKGMVEPVVRTIPADGTLL